MKKRISVTQETSTGRNTKFHDNVTGNNMTRAGFVRQIKSGTYDDYYVRNINGIPTPCSKPDGNKDKPRLTIVQTALHLSGGHILSKRRF